MSLGTVMPLSLNSLHQPLADFFVDRFGDSDEVLFRFDAFGSMLGEDDFAHPADREGVATAAIALERVSDLANRIPRDSGDGVNVLLTSDSIDSFYHDRLLEPAQAAMPPETDTATQKALQKQFEATKVAALQVWAGSELASVTGSAASLRPCEASPTTWYNAGAGGWSRHAFTIQEPNSTASRPPKGPPLDWKAMPSGAVLEDAFVQAKVTDAQLRAGPFAISTTTGGAALPRFQAAKVRDHRTESPKVRDHRSDTSATIARPSLANLDMVQRLNVRQAVNTIVAAKPTTTDRLEISFEFCLVRLNRRSWWSSTFINSSNWRLPGRGTGDLTDLKTPGYMSLLPVAFVAVRNLQISAKWSVEDRKKLLDAMSFGPFTVAGSAGTGHVSERGLQIIGWILQRLPALPPRDWEASRPDRPGASAMANTYEVCRGDTLFAIAQRFYGDGSKYGAIAEANEIRDPNQIKLGQMLRIPPG